MPPPGPGQGINAKEIAREYQSGPLVAAVGVVMYLCGSMGGMQSFSGFLFGLIALVIYLTIMTYIHKREVRMERAIKFKFHDFMSNPRAAAAIMGSDMPSWLTFPAVERSVWFSTVIESLWPRIRAATEGSLQASLNPLLESYRPGFLKKITAESMSLGTTPFNIIGVQSFDNVKNNTLMDLHIQWAGNPDIRVRAEMNPAIAVDVAITDLQLKGVLRVTLGPHIDSWPCFSAISLTFVDKPTLEFNLKAGKVPLDAIPGLAQWLDSFMRDTLAWFMVYPKRYVYEMFDQKWMDFYGSQESDVHPLGTLTIKLKSCHNLPKKGIIGNTAPFASMFLTSNPKTVKKTKTYSGVSIPRFDQEDSSFTFMVYDLPDERLRLEVFHDSHQNILASKTVGRAMADKVISSVDVFTSALTSTCRGGQTKEMTYELQKESSGRKAVHAGSGGTVTLTATYRAFMETEASRKRKERAEKARKEKEMKERGETIAEAEEEVEEEDDEEKDENDEYKLSRSMALPKNGAPLGGLLIITLDCCKNLKKADLFGKSDPYVVFTVGGNKAKSETIMNNLDPEFGNAKFELEVKDIAHEVLKVQVYDYDRMTGILGGDDEIGHTHIEIKEVFDSNQHIDGNVWALKPKGTVKLSLKLLVHEQDREAQDQLWDNVSMAGGVTSTTTTGGGAR